MTPYVLNKRDGVYMINPRETLVSLVRALEVVRVVAESGGKLGDGEWGGVVGLNGLKRGVEG